MPPQRPDLVLTPHIPHIELDILVRHGLDIESHCRDRRNVLPELELIQNGGLARGIETQHQETHLL